jgi:hypothetical protein
MYFSKESQVETYTGGWSLYDIHNSNSNFPLSATWEIWAPIMSEYSSIRSGTWMNSFSFQQRELLMFVLLRFRNQEGFAIHGLLCEPDGILISPLSNPPYNQVSCRGTVRASGRPSCKKFGFRGDSARLKSVWPPLYTSLEENSMTSRFPSATSWRKGHSYSR